MASHPVEDSPGEGRFGRYPRLLGEGSVKRVYEALDRNHGKLVAWNEVDLKLLNEDARQRLYAEVDILKQVNHPHLIDFYGTWRSEEKIVFITEIVESGDLQHFYRTHRVKLKVIKKWCRQVLSALAYLHSHDPPIVHRDIKCENILYNAAEGTVKVGDLGLSCTLDSTGGGALGSLPCGTPAYMAPEMYEGVVHSCVDIYAFGMAVLEMVSRSLPYGECTNHAQIFLKVTQGLPPAALSRIAYPSVASFIRFCIQGKAGGEGGVVERPSAAQILSHPFLDESLPSTPEDEECDLLQAEGGALIGASLQGASEISDINYYNKNPRESAVLGPLSSVGVESTAAALPLKIPPSNAWGTGGEYLRGGVEQLVGGGFSPTLHPLSILVNKRGHLEGGGDDDDDLEENAILETGWETPSNTAVYTSNTATELSSGVGVQQQQQQQHHFLQGRGGRESGGGGGGGGGGGDKGEFSERHTGVVDSFTDTAYEDGGNGNSNSATPLSFSVGGMEVGGSSLESEGGSDILGTAVSGGGSYVAGDTNSLRDEEEEVMVEEDEQEVDAMLPTWRKILPEVERGAASTTSTDRVKLKYSRRETMRGEGYALSSFSSSSSSSSSSSAPTFASSPLVDDVSLHNQDMESGEDYRRGAKRESVDTFTGGAAWSVASDSALDSDDAGGGHRGSLYPDYSDYNNVSRGGVVVGGGGVLEDEGLESGLVGTHHGDGLENGGDGLPIFPPPSPTAGGDDHHHVEQLLEVAGDYDYHGTLGDVGQVDEGLEEDYVPGGDLTVEGGLMNGGDGGGEVELDNEGGGGGGGDVDEGEEGVGFDTPFSPPPPRDFVNKGDKKNNTRGGKRLLNPGGRSNGGITSSSKSSAESQSGGSESATSPGVFDGGSASELGLGGMDGSLMSDHAVGVDDDEDGMSPLDHALISSPTSVDGGGYTTIPVGLVESPSLSLPPTTTATPPPPAATPLLPSSPHSSSIESTPSPPSRDVNYLMFAGATPSANLARSTMGGAGMGGEAAERGGGRGDGNSSLSSGRRSENKYTNEGSPSFSPPEGLLYSEERKTATTLENDAKALAGGGRQVAAAAVDAVSAPQLRFSVVDEEGGGGEERKLVVPFSSKQSKSTSQGDYSGYSNSETKDDDDNNNNNNSTDNTEYDNNNSSSKSSSGFFRGGGASVSSMLLFSPPMNMTFGSSFGDETGGGGGPLQAPSPPADLLSSSYYNDDLHDGGGGGGASSEGIRSPSSSPISLTGNHHHPYPYDGEERCNEGSSGGGLNNGDWGASGGTATTTTGIFQLGKYSEHDDRGGAVNEEGRRRVDDDDDDDDEDGRGGEGSSVQSYNNNSSSNKNSNPSMTVDGADYYHSGGVRLPSRTTAVTATARIPSGGAGAAPTQEEEQLVSSSSAFNGYGINATTTTTTTTTSSSSSSSSSRDNGDMYSLEVSRNGIQITLNFTLTSFMNTQQCAYEILSTIEKSYRSSGTWTGWASFQSTLACLLETLRSCAGLSLAAESPAHDLKISLWPTREGKGEGGTAAT